MISRRSRTGTGQPERQECSSRSRAIREIFAENSGGPAGGGVEVGSGGGDGENGAGDGGSEDGAAGEPGEGDAEGDGEDDGEDGVGDGRDGENTLGRTEFRAGSSVGTATGSEVPQEAITRQAVTARAARPDVPDAELLTRHPSHRRNPPAPA
ncbi:hypothetical protein GCM10010156_70500 [Planobispora rosea]|uniref:Uncharacterized protein n=1 Tax=Planobispora rosea TaxID=35762 RepID=A0A8J3SB86_PLARO|nr:hypothetical protein [Planobispora rosea]GGT02447.1 hypothetical protein GCM10010156_70500 [Planobispora rosea]GIH88539.1 hypothetical protein Pro02_69470 [Planobispora rosea]